MNIDELKKHEFFVIGYEHYNPLGVIRCLGEAGISPTVILLNNKIKIYSKSKYSKKTYYVNSYEEALNIIDGMSFTKKPFIIPCDDNIAELLDLRFDELKDKYYFSNANGKGIISYYENKWNINNLAKECGLDIIKSWNVTLGEIPSDINYPVITKPIISYPGWKDDYYICNNDEELKIAFSKIKCDKVLLQEYKNKINEFAFQGVSACKGKKVFYATQTEYTYLLPDYYSMEMIVKKPEYKEMLANVNKMFSKIQYEGIFDLEFLLSDDNKLYFLEINFRNSAFIYAPQSVGVNLPVIWANSMITDELEIPRYDIKDNYIALAETADYAHRVMRLKLISKKEWKEHVKKADCTFVKNDYDKKPYRLWSIVRLLHPFKKIIKKIIRL